MNEPTISFCGHLAAKPELAPVHGPNGTTVVAKFRVAATPRRKARDSDDWVDGETMWFAVSAWRGLGANCVTSLNQGDRVLVRGRLTQRTWRDGEGVERPAFNVDAEEVALDLSRHAAMSLRKTSGQRVPEQPQPSDDVPWASTGQVDEETGEVLVERLGATATAAGGDTADDEAEAERPIAV